MRSRRKRSCRRRWSVRSLSQFTCNAGQAQALVPSPLVGAPSLSQCTQVVPFDAAQAQALVLVVGAPSLSQCTQVVPCTAIQAQALVPSPLVGALPMQTENKSTEPNPRGHSAALSHLRDIV